VGSTGIDFFLLSSVPGSYELNATVAAANDEVPSNDTKSLPVTVMPLVNVGVNELTGPQHLNVGGEATIDVTLFTGSRPVPGVTAIVVAQTVAEIASVTTSTGTCTRIDPWRFNCNLGDLPGNASVSLAAVVRGVRGGFYSSLTVYAIAPADNNQGDNDRSVSFLVNEPGDVSVRVTNNVETTAGAQFPLTVTARHTGSLVGGRLLITIPAGIVFRSISGSAITCAGTIDLDCSLNDWPQDQDLNVVLNLQASAAGTFTLNARVTSVNDTDAGNNEANSVITAAASSTPPPSTGGGGSSSGSGGGGGGSFDALMLGVLGLLLALGERRRRAVRTTGLARTRECSPRRARPPSHGGVQIPCTGIVPKATYRRFGRRGPADAPAQAAGSVKQNVAPAPVPGSTHNLPSWDSMMVRLIARPSPVPEGFVVTKALKI
jgi:hypothetical protein